MTYVGRFAPSPTGLMHFGSLVAALASYLDAKANKGQWLVRMEDIDPPREQEGAADAILHTLEAHQLHWDREVLFQSNQSELYQQRLAELQQKQLSFRCVCTRQQLKQHSIYPGTCRSLQLGEDTFSSIRLNTSKSLQALQDNSQAPISNYLDEIKGLQAVDLINEVGDFIIHRKDGLFAYHLAVVADDIEQGITHIVRGEDLLSSTAQHILLFKTFNSTVPQFAHIPLALNEQGQKLCKQHHAPAIDNQAASNNLFEALNFLNQSPPIELKTSSCTEILSWGTAHWDIHKLAK